MMAGTPPEFPVAEIIAVTLGLVLLAIAAISYMRAVNALGDLIRSENSGLGTRYFYFSMWLIAGLSSYDVKDPRYSELLWRARRRMVLCFLFFMAVVVAIGWFSRTPA